MNTPGLRDLVVMRVLSDFYWTAATGTGLFTSNSATQQRHAEQQEDKSYTQKCPRVTAQPLALRCLHQPHHWLGADESVKI